jgi:GxxExxY protein
VLSREELNWRTGIIVDACYRVYSVLGPGLLESAYAICLAHELRKRQLHVDTEVLVPIVYDGLELKAAYRADLIVDGEVIVEVKAVESIPAVHKSQLLTYLRLSGSRVGLLINFHSALLKDGITRVVNNL